jgi:RHS repeat-associated protein
MESSRREGWYDYGARFYDPQIGRFTTQDAYAEKYLNLTPYQYGGNNPILFIDFNGDSLVVTGEQSAIDKYTGIVDAGLGGFYTTKVDENGLVTLESTCKEGEMTKEQSAFYDVMSSVTDLEKGNFSVLLVESSENVLIGSFKLESIDVDDVAQFSNGEAASSAGVISHELVEQSAKQLDGSSYPIAHFVKGLGAEDKVNCSTRGSILLSTHTTQNAKGQISGNVDTRYFKKGTTRIVSVHLINNNVTKVDEK